MQLNSQKSVWQTFVAIHKLAWNSFFTYFPAILILNLVIKLPLIYLAYMNYSHTYSIIPLFIYSIFTIILSTFLAIILVRSLNFYAESSRYYFNQTILFAVKRILSIIGLLILAYIAFFIIMFFGVLMREVIIYFFQPDPTSAAVIIVSITYTVIAIFLWLLSFSYTIPAIAIDKKGPAAATIQSFKFTYRNFWRSVSGFFFALIPIIILEAFLLLSFGNIFELHSVKGTVPFIIFEVILSYGVMLLYASFVILYKDSKNRYQTH